MGIIIHIFYEGKNGNAMKFANEMISSGLVDKIRKEEGNLRYEYFFPIKEKETVLLIDAWSNQEALDRHHASNIMQEIAALRDKYDLHMKVEKMLSIEDNRDEKFIRK